MENYIEKLDELIALKKNKGHKITKKESEEFASAWSEMIAAEGGFDEKAERYLYDGFIFAGAKPFVKWVLLSEDKLSALDALFKGRVFGKDTATTFRVLISTLAQLIKEKDGNGNLFCPLIKCIPSSSKNKENKTIRYGHRIVLKYFISEIDDTSVLPELADLDLKPVFINSFISVFDELLKRLNVNALSKKDVQTLAAVNRWLHSERKCVALQETISSLQRGVENFNAQLTDARHRESALEERLADRSNQIACLNLKNKSLEENIQKMSSEIEAKDQEISQRSRMIEALSRDRTKQSDEQLYRLASKLKVEYRDFRDAETLKMDCDLGENMREQLKNVFSILIKAGITLD